MSGLRWPELLLILFVLLLLFGSTRLPALGQSLGSALRGFKKSFSGDGESEPAEVRARSLTGGAPTEGEPKEKSKQT